MGREGIETLGVENCGRRCYRADRYLSLSVV